MTGMLAVFRRELSGYFATPVATVFIVAFLLLASIATFYVGGLLERGQADLRPFFQVHPWLYVVLMPAIAMRLWAEERRSGTIELLLTLPVGLGSVVVGKFLAAWAFTAAALALTVPVWLTVNYLGHPDNGVVLAGYAGSLLMAGGDLAVCACLSALTRNQVVAFVLGVVACLLLTMAGSPIVLDAVAGWAPRALIEAVAGFSVLTRFAAIIDGVIDLRDVVFFASLIALALFANMLVVDLRKGAG